MAPVAELRSTPQGGDGGLAALEGAIGSGGSGCRRQQLRRRSHRCSWRNRCSRHRLGGGATVGGGGGVGGGGPAIKVDGKVSAGQADIVSTSSDGDIQGCINQYRGQIKYCYDGRLRENPNIEGRVEVSFTIAGGRVTTASLLRIPLAMLSLETVL